MIQILTSDGKKQVISGAGKGYGKPIVTLVNGGSASASEIVAGAIQDRKAGILVGEKTFGKASVQSIIPLESGGGLKVTVAHYLTPSGRYIHGKGINPDIVVKNPDPKKDLVLKKALDLLKYNKVKVPKK
jgi:carboxyl-terminal processing protease